MFSNTEFNFNYDLSVEIINSKTRELVVRFDARENDQVVNDAGFEGGGVASGGHTYSVATSSNFYDLIKPYEHQAIIDGVEYKVLSKGYSRSKVGKQFLGRKRMETVVYLG